MHRNHRYIRGRVDDLAESLQELLKYSVATCGSDDGTIMGEILEEVKDLLGDIDYAAKSPERLTNESK